jgi:hypothetical protein
MDFGEHEHDVAKPDRERDPGHDKREKFQHVRSSPSDECCPESSRGEQAASANAAARAVNGWPGWCRPLAPVAPITPVRHKLASEPPGVA